MTSLPCVFCDSDGGRVVWHNELLRVIHAPEPGYPGFYRVVAAGHVREWTDLGETERRSFMRVVEAVELAMRHALSPHKINLASLGNMTPHLHWHVIARFAWDSHFPGSVWSARVREADQARSAEVQAQIPQMETDLLLRLQLFDMQNV